MKSICRSCLYIWKNRVDEPKQCPRCKAPMWKRDKKKEMECRRKNKLKGGYL